MIVNHEKGERQPLDQMTHADKVTEILTSIGVNPRDFDHARRNYALLDEAEIDARVARLRMIKRISKFVEPPQGQYVRT